MADTDLAAALEQARATIAAQEAELQQLRERDSQHHGLAALRDAIEHAATANAILPGTTHSRLLRLIVETAATVLDAETASLFLLDQDTDELVFEVALGQDESEVRKWRLAPGTGIAGMVAATGQPMALTSVQDDPRHAAEIAARMGRKPRSLLCVPLYLEGEPIGVLELLDKRGAPGFTAADISLIGLFAAQAAVAISQSRAQQTIVEMLRDAAGSRDAANEVGALLEQAPDMRQALDLARLVREIASRGPAEAALASSILQAIAAYSGRRR